MNRPLSLSERARAERLATRRAMLIANGHNPEALRVTLWRKPTAAEVRFGHGAIHYREAVVRYAQRRVKLDGVWWNVPR